MTWMDTAFSGVLPNYLWKLHQKALLMAKTLGDDFAAYLGATKTVADDQVALAAAQAKLAADETALTTATSTFAADLVASGVAAVLSPVLSEDESTLVALVNPDGTFTVVEAASPATVVPGSEPEPAPAPTPEPTPTP